MNAPRTIQPQPDPIDEYVRRTIARLAEVPLTEDQKARLAVLLRGPAKSGGAAA